MNVDLSNSFKDARGLINAWEARYSPQEYTYKVVMDVFYRKFTIEKMWTRSKINAIASMIRAILAEMPINDYATIEQVFDKLGAEQSLQ